MLDLSKHPYLKYILFGNIYFANGIQGAIGLMLLIVYFTEKDISIATATMVAGLASIPFTFKFIFGPLTDRFIKRGRKPFVLTSITNLGDYSIGIVSGSLLVFLGYQRFFLYAAWVVGPALIVLYFVKDKWEKNR